MSEQAGKPGAASPLTILFTDAEESTALHAQRGDAEGRAVLLALDAVVRTEIDKHGGRVIKSLGDGHMAAFVSPGSAVRCALAITEAVADQTRLPPHRALRVRVGLHTGEVLEADGDLHGVAVNATARICAQARGGQVLVSDVVRQLCPTLTAVTFQDRGRRNLKGFAEPWQLFEAFSLRSVPVGASRMTSFVGRVGQRNKLTGFILRAFAGHGALVAIGGEPGVGKSRLADEVAIEATQRGMVVARGSCYETEGDRPYMPWVEMLEASAVQMSDHTLRDLLGEDAPMLAQLAPSLRRFVHAGAPVVELPEDQHRRYLFIALRSFLTRAAEIRPRLLVVEDIHWADDSTLILLEQLVDWLRSLPVLVLATYRDTAMDGSPRLATTLARLTRARTVDFMALAPHTELEVEEMLRVLGGDIPPAAVVSAIYQESEGNAFFVVELFRHFADEGRLLDDVGRFRTDLSIDELDVPATSRLVIEQRLSRLGGPTLQVLELAAVIGRHFDLGTLRLMGASDDQVYGALEDAERAQIIVDIGPSARPLYRFAHELIRHTLLTQLPPTRRRRYHLSAAETLLQVHAGEVEVHASEIARHMLRAGHHADAAKTAAYLRMAGDHAQSAAAHEEALRAYEQALAVLPGDRRRERAELLLCLGRARRSLREWDEAVASWKEALGLLEELGDVDEVATLCYVLSRQLAWAYRFDELAEITARGLRAVGEHDCSRRPQLLAMAALASDLFGDPERGDAELAEARRHAGTSNDATVLSDVWAMETVHRYFLMQLRDAEEPGLSAWKRLKETGRLWTLADALAFLEVAYVYCGRYDEAGAVEAELAPLVERLGHYGAAGTLQRCRFVLAAAQRGNLQELVQMVDHGGSDPDDLRIPGYLPRTLVLKGIVAFWQGRWPEADTYVEQSIECAVPFWVLTHQGMLLVMRAFFGERDDVIARLVNLEQRLPRPGRPNLLDSWGLALSAGEAVGILGYQEWSRRLYPLLVEALDTGTLMRQYDGRLVETSAGIVAAAAQLPSKAEHHFERALEQADTLPNVIEQPQVRHFYAQFLLNRSGADDRSHAERLLGEAIAGYAAIGMPRHESLARQLIAPAALSRLASDS